MTRITRNATAMQAMLFAMAVAQPRVTAAEPTPGAKEAGAEIQIGL